MIYMTWPTFCCIAAPALLTVIFFATDIWRKWKSSATETIQVVIGVVAAILLVVTFLMTADDNDINKEEVMTYLKNEQHKNPEEYSEVLYIGEKKVSLNPADNKLYIHLGTGRMIGFDEVVSNSMCRACGQFSKRDTMPVHAYQITQKGWFQSSRVFFSKERDIVLEEAMSVPIK